MKIVLSLVFGISAVVAIQSFPLPHSGCIIVEENTLHYIGQDTTVLTTAGDSIEYVVVTAPIVTIQHYTVRRTDRDLYRVLLPGSDTSTITEVLAERCYRIDKTEGLRECSLGLGRVTVRKPLYPALAAKASIEGLAYVKAFLGTDGTVSNITLLKSSGNSLLDKSAIDFAEKVGYSPATLDEIPLKVLLIMPMGFHMQYHTDDADE